MILLLGRFILLEIDQYWQSYLSSLEPTPHLFPAKFPAKYSVWSFGNKAEEADRLGRLVRDGKKTASCSLLWSYEKERAALPKVGSISIITDSRVRPLCIIRMLFNG